MGGAGGEAHNAAFVEGGLQEQEIVEVPGGEPWIVGHVDVAGVHGVGREALHQVDHGFGHGVDMARCASDGLSQHTPSYVKDTRGDIPAFANDGAEGGADQGLTLLFNDREQAVPHDLQTGLGRGHDAPSLRVRISVPSGATSAMKSALT